MNGKQEAIMVGLVVLLASTLSAATLKQQAQRGDSQAQYELGKRYSERKHYVRASLWFRKAAEQGHPAAQNRLGVMYERGEGVSPDLIEAYKWYTLAAEQKNTFAVANRISLERQLSCEPIAAAPPVHIISK